MQWTWRWGFRLRRGRHEEYLPTLRRRCEVERARGGGELVLEARTRHRSPEDVTVQIAVRQPPYPGARLRVTVFGYEPHEVEVWIAPLVDPGTAPRYTDLGRQRPLAPESERTGAYPLVPEQNTGEHEALEEGAA